VEIIKDGHKNQDSQNLPKNISLHLYSQILVQEILIFRVLARIGKLEIQQDIMLMPQLKTIKRTSKCSNTLISNFQT
jgi:hypothetical protein